MHVHVFITEGVSIQLGIISLTLCTHAKNGDEGSTVNEARKANSKQLRVAGVDESYNGSAGMGRLWNTKAGLSADPIETTGVQMLNHTAVKKDSI